MLMLVITTMIISASAMVAVHMSATSKNKNKKVSQRFLPSSIAY